MTTLKSDFLQQVLPTEPVAASLFNPRTLVIYSDLKVGKSSLAAWISTHKRALWLDLEDGSEALSGLKINILRKVMELRDKGILINGKPPTAVSFYMQLCRELAAAQPPVYDYLIVDKVDQLETWADAWATADYKNSIVGKNFMENTVAAVPYIGWGLWHDKFVELWNASKAAAPAVIFFGSVKLGGSEKWGKHDEATKGMISSLDLDLGNRQRKTAVGDGDATGLMWRAEDGSNWISFVSREKGAFVGNRIARLEGRKFKLSWVDYYMCCGQRWSPQEMVAHELAQHRDGPSRDKQTFLATNWDLLYVNGEVKPASEAKL